MQVAIIKYNAGNVYSVACALERVGVAPIITANKDTLLAADKIIFPGVGEAATAMAHLRAEGLDTLISSFRQPVLGICIGMQLMCRHSEEGDVDGLNIFDVDVKRFVPTPQGEKVPHMGWNTIGNVSGDLYTPQMEGEYVYFVHSYYVPENPFTTATTPYITPFSASLQKDNFYATQFHVEKSGKIGEQILKRFLDI